MVNNTIVKHQKPRRILRRILLNRNFLSSEKIKYYLVLFRFDPAEIKCLMYYLQIDSCISQQNKFHLQEALLLILYRHSQYSSLDQCSVLWKISTSHACRIINSMTKGLLKRYYSLLDISSNPILTQQRVKYYAECLEKRGGALVKNFFFVFLIELFFQ